MARPISLGRLVLATLLIGLSAPVAGAGLARAEGPRLAVHKQAKLTPMPGTAGDAYGRSVDISNNVAVVGAYGANGSTGMVYVYQRTGTSWAQTLSLTPSGAKANDSFGYAVSLSGSTLVAGAPGTHNGDGAVYLIDAGTGNIAATIADPDPAHYGNFGQSVGVSGAVLVVGAASRNGNTGAAYVYAYIKSIWTLQASLFPNTTGSVDKYGYAVGVNGNIVAVGAYGYSNYAGEAFVYVPNGHGGWAQQARFQSTVDNASNEFGYDIHVSGTTIVVSAPGYQASVGATYIFAQNNTTWTQKAMLQPADAQPGDDFGWATIIRGNMTVIGSWTKNVKGARKAGAAYVYTGDASLTHWTLVGEVFPAPISGYAYYGTSVGLSFGTAIVGSPGTNPDGAAFVYTVR